MSTYQKFDDWVVQQYQKLIDHFSAPRMKLIEWLAALYSIIGIPCVMATDYELWIKLVTVVSYLVMSYFCVRDSHRPRGLQQEEFMRLLFFIIFCYNLIMGAFRGFQDELRINALITTFCMYSAYVFMVCKDPPPPKKKFSKKLAFSASN